MKNVFYGAAVVALSLLAGSAEMQAADNEKVYELNVGEFSQLVVEGNINVDYKSDADLAGKAEFTATAAVADCIIFENNKKGKLTIQRTFVEGENADYVMPTVTVYSKFIKELKNSGDSTLRALAIRPTVEFKASVIGNGRLVVRDVDCSKFEGSIKTGNGTLVVSGKSEDTVLSNTGTGAIQADNLESKSVSCHFFGTGTTGCWAIDDLKVKGLSGKLYYRDTPAKIRNYSMGVKIYSLDGKEWKGETSGSQSSDK
jgi:hypothetical protein